MRRLFLMSQDWQYCKEDPIPSRELFVEKLYNIGVYLNLDKEICMGHFFLSIPVRYNRTGVKQSGVSGKDGQYSYGKVSDNASSITMPAPSITSATTLPKVSHSSNAVCDN